MIVYRNLSYFIVGILFGSVIGIILGVLVCDETKRAITKAVNNRAKLFAGDFKSSSEKAMDNVKSSVETVKNTVKDLL
ncbi:MAG: hypothetical protein NQ127_02990 [Candidatus Cardinium sp.]|nr:hypothetical protein [Candidatus Cardinium sp.]